MTVRVRLCEILAAEPDMTVVGEAADGKQAIELCLSLKPDVISMDMMLPVMTGLAATEYIMAHCPTPILVVSASMNRGRAVPHLRRGGCRRGGHDGQARRRRGRRGLGAALHRQPAPGVARAGDHAPAGPAFGPQRRECGARLFRFFFTGRPAARRGIQRTPALLADRAGASTGGPGALVDVLAALPRRLNVPVLVVMHINEPFAAAFADWLDAQTPHRVSYAATANRCRHRPGGCCSRRPTGIW